MASTPDRTQQYREWLAAAAFLGIIYAITAHVIPRIFMTAEERTAQEPSDASNPTDDLQCAHWCLLRSTQMLGAPLTIAEAGRLLPPHRHGHSLLEVSRAVETIGLSVKARNESFDVFTQRGGTAIVHLHSPDHFVVAADAAGGQPVFFDGTRVRRRMPGTVIRSRWTGNLLRLAPANHDVRLPAYVQRTLQDSPCIQFDRLLIDSTDIPYTHTTQDFEYRVLNLGDHPLLIEDVVTDRTCITSEFPHEPIEPASSGRILLRYSVGRGPFLHHAIVHSNDPTFPEVTLTAAGDRDLRVQFRPERLDLREASWGQEKQATVYIMIWADMEKSIQVSNDVECDLENAKCHLRPNEEMIFPLSNRPAGVEPTTATTSRPIRCTSTTSTRRSCTCWESTTNA